MWIDGKEFVLVPMEPTEVMLTYVHRQAYINALAAAPSPSAVQPLSAGFVEASRIHSVEIEQLRSRIEADEALMKDALSAMTTQYPWAEQGQKAQDEWAEKKDAAITALRARLEGEITATRSSPVVWTDTRETPNA